MSGWDKVIAATVLAVIGLVGMNVAIWRRMRGAVVVGRRSVGQIENQPQRVAETP